MIKDKINNLHISPEAAYVIEYYVNYMNWATKNMAVKAIIDEKIKELLEMMKDKGANHE